MPYNVSETEWEWRSTAINTVIQKIISASEMRNPATETGMNTQPVFLNQFVFI